MSVFAGSTSNSQGRIADTPCSFEEQGANHSIRWYQNSHELSINGSGMAEN
jgi:hypothetical protein